MLQTSWKLNWGLLQLSQLHTIHFEDSTTWVFVEYHVVVVFLWIFVSTNFVRINFRSFTFLSIRFFAFVTTPCSLRWSPGVHFWSDPLNVSNDQFRSRDVFRFVSYSCSIPLPPPSFTSHHFRRIIYVFLESKSRVSPIILDLSFEISFGHYNFSHSLSWMMIVEDFVSHNCNPWSLDLDNVFQYSASSLLWVMCPVLNKFCPMFVGEQL